MPHICYNADLLGEFWNGMRETLFISHWIRLEGKKQEIHQFSHHSMIRLKINEKAIDEEAGK